MKNNEIEDTRLGFVGTGTITTAIVTGLCAAPGATQPIYLSPRNAEVAQRLAAAHRAVHIASSNQAVVDASDIVFLAVRPQIATGVLEALRFRKDQRIISLIATFSRQRVASLVTSATTVSCAVPQPTAAMRLSPTAIFPPDPVVAALFARVGTAFQAATEEEFRALFTTTAAMASFFAFLDTLSSWLAAHQVSSAMAREYVARMFQGLSRSHCTPRFPSLRCLPSSRRGAASTNSSPTISPTMESSRRVARPWTRSSPGSRKAKILPRKRVERPPSDSSVDATSRQFVLVEAPVLHDCLQMPTLAY